MVPPPSPPPRGRWAPSPTGTLHLGGARTALTAWLSVRSRGGTLVYRLEDLDPPRVVPGAAAALAADLAWLGLDWDEGPDAGGPFGPYRQSQRSAHYESALARLAAAGRLFPCRLSRKDLLGIASAPHPSEPGGEGPPYPRELRPRGLPEGWLEGWLADAAICADAALRFITSDEPVRFTDRVMGPLEERVAETVGDFVLKRRDGLYAYQLAVVVDDLAMAIDDVVRGADLLASTARQIELARALGGTPPAYAHVPLMVNAQGMKLSKRDAGLTVAALRAAGVTPAALTGYLAFSLGLLAEPAPCRPEELLPAFSWQAIGRAPWRPPSRGADASPPRRRPGQGRHLLTRLAQSGQLNRRAPVLRRWGTSAVSASSPPQNVQHENKTHSNARRRAHPGHSNPRRNAMLVEAQVTIHGSKAAIWAAITNIEHASETLSGIENIEVLEKPANGLVGLKWRETRMLFGKPATAEKWITDAVENEFYKTRAESHGFIFLSTLSLAESGGGFTLTSSHDSQPQGIVARLQSIPMSLLFKGVAKKALLQDLNDIKSAVEQK